MDPLQKSPLIGAARDQELLSAATTYVYQQTPGGTLNAHFFFPAGFNHKTDCRPAIVFFHGGLWDISAPTQFVPHCHHFASRGMIAITVEYRNCVHLGGNPELAIADSKAALSFLKYHAASLGIDADRIVASGASAGGNAALTAALHTHEDPNIPSPTPAALALFGPISDTSPRGVGNHLFSSPKTGKLLSPSNHLPQKDLPPCLIFHGKEDRVIPYQQSAKFAKRYRRKGNHCELMTFEDVGHTFFNYNSDRRNYEITLRSLDHFLVGQNLLGPDPLAHALD